MISHKNTSGNHPNVRVRAILRNVMPVFLQNAREITGRMENALQGLEFESLQQLAHTLKGSSLSYDLNAVGEDCLSLEQACRREDLPAAEMLLNRIVSYLDNVHIEYA